MFHCIASSVSNGHVGILLQESEAMNWNFGGVNFQILHFQGLWNMKSLHTRWDLREVWNLNQHF